MDGVLIKHVRYRWMQSQIQGVRYHWMHGVLIKGVRYQRMQCLIDIGRYHWMVC